MTKDWDSNGLGPERAAAIVRVKLLNATQHSHQKKAHGSLRTLEAFCQYFSFLFSLQIHQYIPCPWETQATGQILLGSP